jgi:hypothetical protein
MKFIDSIVLSLILIIPVRSYSQTDEDALRYSQINIAGTARYTSMGGAFGALGGDFSTLSWNPAGIAIYRTSEFTFSPSLYLEKTNSEFPGNSTNATKYNFNISNLGFVYTQKVGKDESAYGWKNWNFGFGINRINNFHTKSYYQGVNHDNSLLDYFAEHADGTVPENLNAFYENLPYQTYLINPDSNNFYSTVIPSGGELQRRNSTTRGAITEMAISFGGKYSNKLYLGGSLGFDFLRYIEETTYEELDATNSIPGDFNNFSFNQNVTTHGVGINLKLGLIYRAADWVRLGAAFHTPTFYSMTDDFSNSMQSSFDNGDVYSQSSPAGTFDYNLTTPLRAIGSVAFIIGKTGLISADYEFVDYSSAEFDASGVGLSDVNNTIQNKYTAAGNLRIGTEWRYENFSFRGGYAMSGSPFNSTYKPSGADMSQNSYSLGLGIRDQDFFIDFGYILSKRTDFFQPYVLNFQGVPGVTNDIYTSNFTITLGAKF